MYFIEWKSDVLLFSSDNSTNTSQYKIIDDVNTKEFKKEDNRFIFEIFKSVELPSSYWYSPHLSAQNVT